MIIINRGTKMDKTIECEDCNTVFTFTRKDTIINSIKRNYIKCPVCDNEIDITDLLRKD